jgi:hypothetical protein
VLDSPTLADLRDRIEEATIQEKPLLDAAIADARELIGAFRALRPRSATPFSLVASDGGENRLRFNPFSLTFVRVVDSKGKTLMIDAISPSADLSALSARHREARDPLGLLMEDLGVDSIAELSPMLGGNARSWASTYRDICEWATLYERIVHRDHANSTVFVRDGLLRTPIFERSLLAEMYARIAATIERNLREERIELFLVGVAKHSEVHSRYELAMAAAGLPDGHACWAPVPHRMQQSVYHRWPDYVKPPLPVVDRGATLGERRTADPGERRSGDQGERLEEQRHEPPGRGLNMGAMHFVRFGPSRRDRIWTVDVLDNQRGEAHKALAALLADAENGFPIPFYPLSLQKADEHAQIADFDREILSDYLIDAVRRRMPESGSTAVDAMLLSGDPTAWRYE